MSGSTQPTNLERRVLVRGFVQLSPEVCDPSKDSDCDQVSALVMAERLWMPNADASNTPGPYFHTATTFTDPLTGTEGAYALPLDPGVWLVTALPFAGSRGGPAGIEILDLRNGMDRAKDFELRLGVRVNFKLEGFDPRTEVMPLDLGSWTGHDHPGRSGNLDLNAPGECLSTDSSQGCQIRRLLPLGALARPNAVNIVQITTREPAGDDGRCP